MNKLVMTFEPNTIEHLGIKMYSKLTTALAELIANSYDACSPYVDIRLYDYEDDLKRIIIEDFGIGMSFNEINKLFLRIGRNRRIEGEESTPCGRIPTGKKGLGKLALFGLGKTIEIITRKKSQEVKFILDWDDIMNTDGRDYEPKYSINKCDNSKTGTKIALSNLKRKTNFELDSLTINLSKLFNFPDTDFKIHIYLNDAKKVTVDNKLKYSNIEPEFVWELPEFFEKIEKDFHYKKELNGKIITTAKPLKPGMRGITLFANGRMVNLPEFFGISESSHFFSYTTGWINVDYIDNFEKDYISTNRQAIDWEHEETQTLRAYIQEIIKTIHYNWREERKNKRKKTFENNTKINIDNWLNKLPDEINKKVKPIVSTVLEKSELPEKNQNEVVETIHELIPEYPYYHWRHLHNEIKQSSEKDYKNADYYRAFQEAVKRYISIVRNKSSSNNQSDFSLMGEVFGYNKILSVVNNYKKPDGTDFHQSTKSNIENGQKLLSMGIVAGCRNPVSHEEITNLRESGLFSEKDCLDALSLLSHLFKRHDDAKTNNI